MRKYLKIIFIIAIVFFINNMGVYAETKEECEAYCSTVAPEGQSSCLVNRCGESNAATIDMNIYQGEYVQCGNSGAIPSALPKLSRILVTLVEILVPLALIIFGMLDFLKAVASNDSDFLDKAKKKFIRRIISAVAVFFIFVIVKFVVSNVATDTGAMDCLDCFINDVTSCKAASR